MIRKILATLALLGAAALAHAGVDVNKASAAELDGVKGVGPSMSTRILEERKKGEFKDWADFISRVKGIGEGNAARYSSEGLTVNGATFKAAAGEKMQEKKEGAKPFAKKEAAPAAK